MAIVFDTIITQGVRSGQIPARTNSARDWFRDTAGKMNRINEREMMKGDISRMTTQPLLGSMYMFYYDPKWKDELPYYDRFPLIFPYKKVKGGFMGLNLHYLPPILRAKMLDALMDIQSSPKCGDAKFNLRYKTLKASSKLKWYKPCFKHYLNTQVESRFAEVSAPEWEIATFLPTASWRKSNSQKVFADSRKQIGK